MGKYDLKEFYEKGYFKQEGSDKVNLCILNLLEILDKNFSADAFEQKWQELIKSIIEVSFLPFQIRKLPETGSATISQPPFPISLEMVADPIFNSPTKAVAFCSSLSFSPKDLNIILIFDSSLAANSSRKVQCIISWIFWLSCSFIFNSFNYYCKMHPFNISECVGVSW